MKGQSMKRTVGWICLAGFVACIYVANYAIAHWGQAPAFPGGPHTVTLLGLTAPSGVLVVGLSFSLRDGAQISLGRWWVLLAIAVGAVLAYFATNGDTKLAFASALAFLIGETCDWLAYTPLIDRGKTASAITLSNTVGSAVDSFVFLLRRLRVGRRHRILLGPVLAQGAHDPPGAPRGDSSAGEDACSSGSERIDPHGFRRRPSRSSCRM
jgi:uncharacterized PurR-regulated membrane protein YhhQ (DUF165 family)